MASSLAKKTKGLSIVGAGRAYSNKMSRKDKYSRNYYNCRGFGHLARNCRNRRIGNIIGKERRLEYRNDRQNNLNRDRDLIVLN